MGATQQPGSDTGSGTATGVYLRLLGAFAALGAGATAVVLGALLVHGLPAIASTSSASTPAASTNDPVATAAPTRLSKRPFPAPPRGAVVFGAQAGENALGLAILPGREKIGLQASVLDIQGEGLKGRSVRFDVTGAAGHKTSAAATSCGRGCYRATVGIARPRSVEVRISRERPVSIAMPAQWPPQRVAGIVRRAEAAWRKLRTLSYHESLGDGNVVLESDWKIVSPDRLAFRITRIVGPKRNQVNAKKNLGAGILIGDSRWDQPSGSARWQKSPQLAVQQPVPFWTSATNVYLLGTVVSRGRPAWKVSFYDPLGGPGWFTILVDKETLHTTEMWMTAADHFMHETYHSFNAPITITPPSN